MALIKDKILVIEDEKSISYLLGTVLTANGYDVIKAYTGTEACEMLDAYCPDLILLDLGLPDMDGVDIIRRVRSRGTAPIVVVSARTRERDKIEALDLGADDYITKPYNIPILLARVKAVLRRGGGLAEPDVVEAGGLRLSLTRGTVSADGRTAELSRNELRILAHLMTHAGEIVSRADLIEALWDSQIYIDDNTLSVNVTRLRGKLEALGVPGMIRTRRGMGYQYDGA